MGADSLAEMTQNLSALFVCPNSEFQWKNASFCVRSPWFVDSEAGWMKLFITGSESEVRLSFRKSPVCVKWELKVSRFQKQITSFSFPPKKNENPFLLLRAESEKYFRSFFGGKENILICFWNFLPFRVPLIRANFTCNQSYDRLISLQL